MKNDFREFYDEDYILHSMSEEEYIAHGEWANNIRKYIDKVRTRSGKWKYIYPEDLKKKAENVKRDVSYAARNLKSKVTGKNKTFKNKVEIPQPGDTRIIYEKGFAGWGDYHHNVKREIHNAYAKEQKKGNIGNAAYQKRITPYRLDQKVGTRNLDSMSTHVGSRIYGQSDYSKVMNKVAKKKEVSAASKAQKTKIYGTYADQQKKKVSSAASKAQKAQIYNDYIAQQKKKQHKKSKGNYDTTGSEMYRRYSKKYKPYKNKK